METQQFRTSITEAWDFDPDKATILGFTKRKNFRMSHMKERWSSLERQRSGVEPARFLSLDSPKTAYTEQVLSGLFFGRQEDKQRRPICIAATIPSINKNSDEEGKHPSAWLALSHLQSRVFSTLALVPQF